MCILYSFVLCHSALGVHRCDGEIVTDAAAIRNKLLLEDKVGGRAALLAAQEKKEEESATNY